MVAWVAFGAETASALPTAELELGRGAIIGALLVGAAFLAGMAVLRRSAAAFCGLLMLSAGAAMQAVWLGVIPAPAPTFMLLLEGIFAASALIFLSATIGMASRNQLLGGLLFAGALSMVGIGVINAVLAGEASGLLRFGLAAVAVAAIGLSMYASARGDVAARLILPGAALAAAAPFLFSLGGGGLLSLAPQALFAVGILTASLVAMGDFSRSGGQIRLSPDTAAQFSGAERHFDHRSDYAQEKALRVSENQLAQVLDYSGIAVWDWSRNGGHQTESFASLMGADSDGSFTPDAIREFIHSDDRARFDEMVLGPSEGDGGYDETLKLHNGKRVRMRGARAVDRTGAVERIVVFIDDASATNASSEKSDALKMAAASLTGAAAKAAKTAPGEFKERRTASVAIPVKSEAEMSVAAAIDGGELVAAFQPIISFDTGRICGAEALVRWPAGESKEGGKTLTTEEIVREAQRAGKGAKLTAIMMKATAEHLAEKVAAGEKNYFAAFNVSLSQVREPGFVEEVKAAIAERKLPKGALVLELTEGEQLGETPKINDTFKKLRAAGASLAYDDFGAGFSSLSNLHKYDFDYLKIDKSFIDDIVANGGKKKIVAALAKLGRDFDMTVIAEGIETAEAAETAKAIGCRMGQGYHLGQPAMRAGAKAEEQAAVQTNVDAAATEASATPAAAEAEILVLDKSLEAGKPSGGRVRRRLFSGGLR
jgi:EAL domain-containing protein (putative c-di-GMP-specific phosphodiesterase class I)/PAS domain-containing protein